MQIRHIKDIEYRLLPGTPRQTTDIVIERDGCITVRPPACMTPEQVDETVFSRRLWIYRNLAEWRDLNSTRVVREWVNGESFLYLGSAYRLLLVAEQDEPVKLKDGRLVVTYGYRAEPYGIRARISSDEGATWNDEVVLRSDGGTWDLGYPRTVQRPDGKLVTAYYYNVGNTERFIGATIWEP